MPLDALTTNRKPNSEQTPLPSKRKPVAREQEPQPKPKPASVVQHEVPGWFGRLLHRCQRAISYVVGLVFISGLSVPVYAFMSAAGGMAVYRDEMAQIAQYSEVAGLVTARDPTPTYIGTLAATASALDWRVQILPVIVTAGIVYMLAGMWLREGKRH